MARVNVDQVALTDGRFARLAQLRGWADADHARGKMLLVWNETIHRGAELPVWLVDHHLAAGGAGDLLECGLASLVTLAGESAGVPAGGTIIRIKGCAGRSDYLDRHLKTSKAGGKARAAGASRAAGRFTSRADQPAAGDDTSAPAPAPAPDTKEEYYVSGKPDLVGSLAGIAVGEINRLAGTAFETGSKTALDLARALVKNKHSEADTLAVIRSKRDWIAKPDMRQHFCPSTLLGARNFQKYLDDLRGRGAQAPLSLVRPDEPETMFVNGNEYVIG